MFAQSTLLPPRLRVFPAMLFLSLSFPFLAACGYNTIPTAEEMQRQPGARC